MLTTEQFTRVQALREAVDLCKNRPTVTDEQVLTIAGHFAEFIRTGRIPQATDNESR